MKTGDALKIAVSSSEYTYEKLAEELGYATRSGITNKIFNPNGVRSDILIKICRVLGFEVVLRKGDMEIVITE